MIQTMFLSVSVGLLMLLSSCTMPPVPDNLLRVGPGLSIGINPPGDKWMVTSAAPDFLVEDMAEHVAHDLESQGKPADLATIEAAVAKRLTANEFFIFNPASGAHMEIDFSPLEAGSLAPSRGTVSDSARYAADSLGSEEGIDNLSWQVDKSKVYGADYVYSLEASFNKHEVPTRFYGLVGFADTSWFFIYYTDAGKDAEDYPQAMQIIRSLQVVRDEKP